MEIDGENGSKPSYFDVHSQQNVNTPHPEKLHGEWEDLADKVEKHSPKSKIIFTLRNPVTRAHSQYWKSVREGKEKAPTFEEALDQEISGKRTPENSSRCWIYKSQYQIHLDEWFSRFPKDQILILVMEEWIDFPDAGLAPLERFLGLEKYSLRDYPIRKKKESKPSVLGRIAPLLGADKGVVNPPMSDIAREELEKIFAVDKLYVANALDRYQIEAWLPQIKMTGAA